MSKKEIIKNVLKSRRVVTRPDYRDLGAILLFILLVPYIVSFFFGNVGAEDTREGGGQQEGSGAQSGVFQDDIKKSEYIVYNKTAAGTERMPLETYLVNCLPSTIDMGYEMETLKAQAVVLRTELMKQAEGGGNVSMWKAGWRT